MNTARKIPGAASEPVAVPAVHCMFFTKAGWYCWAICSCGWAQCNPDKYELEILAQLHSAANHDLRQVS